MNQEIHVREIVAEALNREGRSDKARLAANPALAFMENPIKLPGGATAIPFAAFPHARLSFYVGIVEDRVFYLTESPEGFAAMMQATGWRVDHPDSAAAVARAYVETTRSMNVFSGVIDSVDDITWAPSPPGRHLERDTAINRLRDIVVPPSAKPADTDFVVTLYVLRGSTVERRTVTIAENGSLREHAEVVATHLPVPISM